MAHSFGGCMGPTARRPALPRCCPAYLTEATAGRRRSVQVGRAETETNRPTDLSSRMCPGHGAAAVHCARHSQGHRHAALGGAPVGRLDRWCPGSMPGSCQAATSVRLSESKQVSACSLTGWATCWLIQNQRVTIGQGTTAPRRQGKAKASSVSAHRSVSRRLCSVPFALDFLEERVQLRVQRDAGEALAVLAEGGARRLAQIVEGAVDEVYRQRSRRARIGPQPDSKPPTSSAREPAAQHQMLQRCCSGSCAR
jgi:hypothetical protein